MRTEIWDHILQWLEIREHTVDHTSSKLNLDLALFRKDPGQLRPDPPLPKYNRTWPFMSDDVASGEPTPRRNTHFSEVKIKSGSFGSIKTFHCCMFWWHCWLLVMGYASSCYSTSLGVHWNERSWGQIVSLVEKEKYWAEGWMVDRIKRKECLYIHLWSQRIVSIHPPHRASSRYIHLTEHRLDTSTSEHRLDTSTSQSIVSIHPPHRASSRYIHLTEHRLDTSTSQSKSCKQVQNGIMRKKEQNYIRMGVAFERSRNAMADLKTLTEP